MVKVRIPQSLQAVLWSADIKDLDLEKDKPYIVNQVLGFGLREHLEWLFSVYPKAEIIRIFLEKPIKIYYRSAWNFAKSILLKDKIKLDKYRYLRDLPRKISRVTVLL